VYSSDFEKAAAYLSQCLKPIIKIQVLGVLNRDQEKKMASTPPCPQDKLIKQRKRKNN